MAMTPEATLQGIRLMGSMLGEMVKAMTEAGLTREEALYIAKEWLISTLARSKPDADSLVQYMKTLNPMEPKKQ
jgi:hypothetical protein